MRDKQTNAREAYRPALASPCEVITMLNRTDKTWAQEASSPRRSETHKASQNKNNTKTTALER